MKKGHIYHEFIIKQKRSILKLFINKFSPISLQMGKFPPPCDQTVTSPLQVRHVTKPYYEQLVSLPVLEVPLDWKVASFVGTNAGPGHWSPHRLEHEFDLNVVEQQLLMGAEQKEELDAMILRVFFVCFLQPSLVWGWEFKL